MKYKLGPITVSHFKWPGFRVNSSDPDSGSIQVTRNPCQNILTRNLGQFKFNSDSSLQNTNYSREKQLSGERKVSIQMTRNPVISNDPDSGSIQITRNPGQLKWPGICVNSNDTDIGLQNTNYTRKKTTKHLCGDREVFRAQHQSFWTPSLTLKLSKSLNSTDQESGSFKMTRIPGQFKWPGIRVISNSGSIQVTRNPGQFKWPGIRVNSNDPDSKSIQVTRIPGQFKMTRIPGQFKMWKLSKSLNIFKNSLKTHFHREALC